MIQKNSQQKSNLFELIKRGSRTAKQGFSNEKDVVIKFNSWKTDEDAQGWLRIMNYSLSEIERVEAVQVKGSHKTDVQVKIKIYLRNLIAAENISVKLVSNETSGFNQIDKRWIDKYTDLWAIPSDVVEILKLFTGENKPISKELRDPRRMFFNEMSEDDQEKIVKFFEENKIMIITDILKGRDKLGASWMLIYIKPSNLWSLLPISVVMNYYGSGPVTLTRLGNIKIGKIGMQRKGGDNGRPAANMLQFKFNPIDIVRNLDNG